MNGLNSDREKSLRRVRTLRNTWRISMLLTRRGLRTNHPRYAGVIMHEKPWSEWVCRRSCIKGMQINHSRFGELGLCNFGNNARKRGGKAVARTGCEIGFFAVLHSWGQNLPFHPHLHCVVPGGGISLGGTRWISCRRAFLLVRDRFHSETFTRVSPTPSRFRERHQSVAKRNCQSRSIGGLAAATETWLNIPHLTVTLFTLPIVSIDSSLRNWRALALLANE